MPTILIYAATIIGIVAIGLYANYGTLEPCGMLRAKARNEEKLLALLPDNLLNAALATRFGPLTPLRCIQLMTEASPPAPGPGHHAVSGNDASQGDGA